MVPTWVTPQLGAAPVVMGLERKTGDMTTCSVVVCGPPFGHSVYTGITVELTHRPLRNAGQGSKVIQGQHALGLQFPSEGCQQVSVPRKR